MTGDSQTVAPLRVPQVLHDVLGERTQRGDVAFILLAGAVVASLFAYQVNQAGLAWWRSLVAIALVADIASGAIANLTQGTNDYYVERPGHRWVFIAIHVHVLVLAWAVQAPLSQAAALWAFTISGAILVNVRLGSASQSSLAGLIVTIGAAGLLSWQRSIPPELTLVYLLFLFKVVFSFAVDHHATRSQRTRTAIHALSPRDQPSFIKLIVAAFADDPLFLHLFPPSDPSSATDRCAFASFALDVNRVFGGTPRGLFVDGRLVAAWLLEPPLPRWKQALASAAAILRGIPLLIRLGPTRMQWLNEYTRRTRAAMPDGPHHYLVMLGVRPDQQGRGYGGAALRDITAEVRNSAESLGLGLDTENQRNVALYERFEFQSLCAPTIDQDVIAYCMVQQSPKPAAS